VPIIALTVFAVMFFSLGWDKLLQGTGIAFSNTDIALIVMGIVGVIIFAVIITGGKGEASPKKEG
jgi:hypothetical protein